ncbi:DUF6776 family protein [Celerinatantimonas sp. YJH-8]|uniref:DUF6776 family protein n=1 Tax=Celerinatantimonas sp. YJH-8 TaxID=3228714 RepID=UPI0038C769CA
MIRWRWVGLVNLVILVAGFSVLGWMSNLRQQELVTMQQVIQQYQSREVTNQEQLLLAQQQARQRQAQIVMLRHMQSDQQQKLVTLQRQVDFYRKIMAPEQAKTGVLIDSIQIDPLADAQHYRVHFVVIQAGEKNRQERRGEAQLMVSGNRQGQTVQYSLAELSDQPQLPLKLRFFAETWISLKLPDDFQPEFLQLTVIFPGSRYLKPIHLQQQMDWPDRHTVEPG